MGDGFCSLYQEIHYLEVCYIEVWVYIYDKIVKSHDAMPVSYCAIYRKLIKGIVRRFQIHIDLKLAVLGQTLQFASV